MPLWRLLQRSRLFQQLSELRSAQRTLRLSQHRASLRIKRAAVRARVVNELHRERLAHLLQQVEATRTTARITQLHAILTQLDQRREALHKHAKARGVPPPPLRGSESQRAFKRRVIERAEAMVHGVGGGETTRLVRESVRRSVDDVALCGDDDALLGVQIIAKLADDAGLQRTELEHLLRSVERSEDDGALRHAVLRHLSGAPPRHSAGATAEPSPPPPPPPQRTAAQQ